MALYLGEFWDGDGKAAQALPAPSWRTQALRPAWPDQFNRSPSSCVGDPSGKLPSFILNFDSALYRLQLDGAMTCLAHLSDEGWKAYQEGDLVEQDEEDDQDYAFAPVVDAEGNIDFLTHSLTVYRLTPAGQLRPMANLEGLCTIPERWFDRKLSPANLTLGPGGTRFLALADQQRIMALHEGKGGFEARPLPILPMADAQDMKMDSKVHAAWGGHRPCGLVCDRKGDLYFLNRKPGDYTSFVEVCKLSQSDKGWELTQVLNARPHPDGPGRSLETVCLVADTDGEVILLDFEARTVQALSQPSMARPFKSLWSAPPSSLLEEIPVRLSPMPGGFVGCNDLQHKGSLTLFLTAEPALRELTAQAREEWDQPGGATPARDALKAVAQGQKRFLPWLHCTGMIQDLNSLVLDYAWNPAWALEAQLALDAITGRVGLAGPQLAQPAAEAKAGGQAQDFKGVLPPAYAQVFLPLLEETEALEPSGHPGHAQK